MAKRSKLSLEIHDAQEHLRLNGAPDADEEDALERLMDACGRTREGSCTLGGANTVSLSARFGSDG